MEFRSFPLFFAFTVAWLSCAELLWELLVLHSSSSTTARSVTRPPSKFYNFRSHFYWRKKSNKKMSQFPLIHMLQWMRDTSDEVRLAWTASHTTRSHLRETFKRTYFSVPHADLILTAMGTLSIAWFVRRSLHRYKNANDLPLSFFEGRQKKLKGLAVSVNDSDNIRFYHQPHFFSLFRPNLSRQGILILKSINHSLL